MALLSGMVVIEWIRYFAAWDGKCLGDIVWSSLWCRAAQDVGNIHAEIMGHLACHDPCLAPHLHICSSNPRVFWRNRGDFSRRRFVTWYLSSHKLSWPRLVYIVCFRILLVTRNQDSLHCCCKCRRG